MIRSHLTNSFRAALVAAAALGATAFATTQSAEARHLHGLGLSISIGDGYGSSIRIGRSCRSLYRTAVRTGDPYWWDRYYDCRAGY